MSSLFSVNVFWGCLHILVNVGLGFVVRSSLPVRSSSFPRNCQLLSMVSKICVSMQISPLYPLYFILYTTLIYIYNIYLYLYYPNMAAVIVSLCRWWTPACTLVIMFFLRGGLKKTFSQVPPPSKFMGWCWGPFSSLVTVLLQNKFLTP